MPRNKSALRRLRIIDQILKEGPISSKDLHRRLNYLISPTVSLSQIQKDLADLREGDTLGTPAPLKDDPKTHKWSYTEDFHLFSSIALTDEETASLRVMASSLSLYKEHGLFRQFTNAISKVLEAVELKLALGEEDVDTQIIQTDDPPTLSGSEHLAVIVEAIRGHKRIRFLYRKYGDPKDKQVKSEKYRELAPYMVKEFMHRWYVIGQEGKGTRTFALDRISNLEEMKESFILPNDFSRATYFKNNIGVTRKTGTPVKVILRASYTQGQYLSSLPLHHSQRELNPNGSSRMFSLEVEPNHEFYMAVLALCPEVEVISPSEVRMELHRRLFEGAQKNHISEPPNKKNLKKSTPRK